VRVLLDEESTVLKAVLRVLYLGETSTRANINPAAAQLLTLLGRLNFFPPFFPSLNISIVTIKKTQDLMCSDSKNVKRLKHFYYHALVSGIGA
jgi:hypothetical protein